MKILDQIRGTVYGQALGDAFCTPPLLTRETTRAAYPVVPDTFIAPPANHMVHFGLRAGSVTDDTEQAMFLAREIIADGRVTAEGTARAVVDWYDFVGGDTIPFVGPSTRRAVAKIRAGQSLDSTGIGGDTNGAAMRVSVVGTLFPGDVAAAARAGALSATPTHNTSVGCASAAAVAGAVARALGANADVRSVVIAGIESAEIGALIGQTWLGANVARRIEFAVGLARDGQVSEDDRLQAIFDLIGTSLAASESIPAAFAVFALADGDPLRAAKLAFSLSGDADTIGAIACAMAGALRGVDVIPEEMRAQLRAANPNYDFDDVAQKLFGLL
ncbi:MAG: ADP-ribosylglycohydrolase family protein [Chloroflexi bacterium]|nr:ADP-ribosylglycohydrolase family protein [Chloroflexota bacterium]